MVAYVAGGHHAVTAQMPSTRHTSAGDCSSAGTKANTTQRIANYVVLVLALMFTSINAITRWYVAVEVATFYPIG